MKLILANGYEVKRCYPLTVDKPASDVDLRDWQERLANLYATDELIKGYPDDKKIPNSRDFIFQNTDDVYYLVPYSRDKSFEEDLSQILKQIGEDDLTKFGFISRQYRHRPGFTKQPLLGKDDQDEDDDFVLDPPLTKPKSLDAIQSEFGITQLPPTKPYKPGHWLTGAPAMAGAISVGAITTVGAMQGLKNASLDVNWDFGKLGHLKFDATFMSNPLFTTLLIAPLTAGFAAFTFGLASNCVAYMLENKGKIPEGEAYNKIYNDSVQKGGQMLVGFLLVEGTRHALQSWISTAAQKAWCMAISAGPAEFTGIMMLSMSLAVGIGMAVGMACMQAYQYSKKGEEFRPGEIAVAFVTGLVAGATASFDFGNQGLSFLATWAAFSLFPVINTLRKDGREEMLDNVQRTKNVVTHVRKRTLGLRQQVHFNKEVVDSDLDLKIGKPATATIDL